MKKLFLGICIISSAYSLAQTTYENFIEGYRFNKFLSQVTDGGKKINYDDVQGSAYLNKKFQQGIISGIKSEALLRYSTLLDNFEIRVNDDVYEIPRNSTFSEVRLLGDAQRFILLDTGDDNKGYFQVLNSGNTKVLKKYRTIYRPERPTQNPVLPNVPATFEDQKPVYYIKFKDNTILVPKNFKDFSSLFSDKKTELEAFMKENKIKSLKEPDLIKIASFLDK